MHTIHPTLLDAPVRVALIGAGGNGSQMLSGLARLDRAIRAVGHPGGLDVSVYDPDTVSESNVGRQLFYASDVGQSKAVVLVHRLNLAYGLNWQAWPVTWDAQTLGTHIPPDPFHLVITCVDSARARREIHKILKMRAPHYWLDLGNRQQDGQVILGELEAREQIVAVSVPVQEFLTNDPRTFNRRAEARLEKARQKLEKARLPTVVDVFPEILNPKFVEDDAPSCSLAEALEKQDLFVNQSVATWALHLLWRLFRQGAIEHHGYFINLATGRVNPLPVPVPKAAQSTLRKVA